MQPVMFFEYFALWIWLGEKDRQTGQGWASLCPKYLWMDFQPQDYRVRCWCWSQAFGEGVAERDFVQRAEPSGGHGITQGKMRQERLLVSLLYLFPGVSTPEDKHTEMVSHWWCPWDLTPLVITILPTWPQGPEPTQPCVCSRVSLLGRMRWLIVGISLVKYVMRSVWVTCSWVPSVEGRFGGGIIKLGYLGPLQWVFPLL